jgi:hypothetical protein
MKRYYKAFFLFLSFNFFLFSSAYAQQKYERESRIESNQVPKEALEFVQSLSFISKIKWYKETGLNTTTIEAKTKYKGKKYSIEFDKNGLLEDIEIIIKKKTIPSNSCQQMSSKLEQDLGKYRVEKIQIQYSGNIESVRKKILSGSDSENLITQYELIVSAKKNRKYQKFEYLFSNTGEFLKRSDIVLINTDNLEY